MIPQFQGKACPGHVGKGMEWAGMIYHGRRGEVCGARCGSDGLGLAGQGSIGTAGVARDASSGQVRLRCEWRGRLGKAGADGSDVAWLDGKGNAGAERCCSFGRRRDWTGEACNGRTGTVGSDCIGTVGMEWQAGRVAVGHGCVWCALVSAERHGKERRGSAVKVRAGGSGLLRRGEGSRGNAVTEWSERYAEVSLRRSRQLRRGGDRRDGDGLGKVRQAWKVEAWQPATGLDRSGSVGRGTTWCGKAGSTTQTKSPCSNTGRKQLTNET